MTRRDRFASTSALLMLFALAAAPAGAAAPRPPGGHIPLHFGGYNGSGYPITTAVPGEPKLDLSRWRVVVSPNPSRGATVLRFTAREDERLRVRLYSLGGRLVRQWTGVAAQSGSQEYRWEARDDRGAMLPVGIYFYRVEAGPRAAGGRIALIR